MASTPMDVQDASNVLQALASAPLVTDSFTSSQRQEMSEAVAANLGGPAVDQGQQKRHHQQLHYHFHKYLLESDWAVLTSPKTDNLHKVSVLVSCAHRIGLLYPTELTVTAIVSIIKLTSGTEIMPHEMFRLLSEYKRANKAKRCTAPCGFTLQTFSPEVNEFIKSYPSCFGDKKPHPSPFTDEEVERARSTIAARKTHHTLSKSVATSTSSSSSSPQNPAMQLHALTEALLSRFAAPSFAQTPLHIFSRPQPAEPLTPTVTPTTRQLVLPALQDFTSPADDSQGLSPRACATPEDEDRSGAVPSPLGKEPSPQSKSSKFQDSIDEVQKALACKRASTESNGKRASRVMKRPASAAADRQCISVVASRNCVTARTGLAGPGSTKSFSFRGDPSEAKAAAEVWLRGECKRLGMECTI
jgi:hypothetical protein